MKKLLVLIMTASVIFGTLVIAGQQQKAQAYNYDGGYYYAFPTSPTLEKVRRMMLGGCAIVSYPNVWVCPDAPPYTY